MSRIVKCGLIQTSLAADVSRVARDDPRRADRAHARLHRPGRRAKACRCICMQEIFTGPYFCAEQNTRWYDSVEKIPDGPTTKLMQEYAKKYSMVIVVPIYEEEATGVYYNTAAVIDADGTLPRQVPQEPHPARRARLLGEVLLPPRQPRLPGVRHAVRRRSASTSATTATSPRARASSAWTARRSSSIRRRPWPASPSISGSSSSPRTPSPTATSSARSTASASKRRGTSASSTARATSAIRAARSSPSPPRDKDALVIADLDLDKIREVRNTWQFFRDRRPETYQGIVRL